MIETRWRAGAGLLGILSLALSGPVAQEPPAPGGDTGSQRGALDPASKSADDADIPVPGALSPATPARAFVESFLVALAQRTPGVVHATYLSPGLRETMPIEAFLADVRDLRAAAGPLARLSVTYLRQRNAAAEGEIDGGWATYLAQFERDPRVAFRVDFERGAEGLWQVTSFTVDSPQVQRLRQARTQAAPEAAGPPTAKEPPAPPPVSAESDGGR